MVSSEGDGRADDGRTWKRDTHVPKAILGAAPRVRKVGVPDAASSGPASKKGVSKKVVRVHIQSIFRFAPVTRQPVFAAPKFTPFLQDCWHSSVVGTQVPINSMGRGSNPRTAVMAQRGQRKRLAADLAGLGILIQHDAHSAVLARCQRVGTRQTRTTRRRDQLDFDADSQCEDAVLAGDGQRWRASATTWLARSREPIDTLSARAAFASSTPTPQSAATAWASS